MTAAAVATIVVIVVAMGFNFKMAPWNLPTGKLIRQAVAWAMPYDEILKQDYLGDAKRWFARSSHTRKRSGQPSRRKGSSRSKSCARCNASACTGVRATTSRDPILRRARRFHKL